MDDPAEIDADLEPGLDPLFKCDDFALYQDPQNFKHDKNERASMLAQVGGDDEDRILFGDVYLVCADDLAKRLIDNDQAFQKESSTARAFHAWMLEYSEKSDVSLSLIALTVGNYIAGILKENEKAEEKREVQRIADLLGIDPAQIGVIRL